MFTLSLQAETPKEASKAILELLNKKDYDSIFRKRYTEIHKAKTEDQVKKVIKSLSKAWSKNHQMFVQMFTELSKKEFTISDHKHAQKTETGRKATATIKMGKKEFPYNLYEMKNGTWGFHM